MKRFFCKLISLLFLAPVASLWVLYQERRIRKHGKKLSQEQMEWARKLGIKHVERMFLIREPELTFPCPKFLTALLAQKGFSISQAAGMSLRYGIFISNTVTASPHLICHEFTHTLQYERFGGVYGFLSQYLFECIYFGYSHAPMEHEADALADECLNSTT